MSELICGRIAAGENYNLTRDSTGAPESRLACLRLDDMKEFYA